MTPDNLELRQQFDSELCSSTEFAHSSTRSFIRGCVLDGTVEEYLNKDQLPPRTFKARERAYRLTIIYFGTSASHDQVGQIFGGGISPERVRQLIKKTFVNLDQTARTPFNNRCPLSEIPLSKRLQATTALTRGGRSGSLTAKIASLAQAGATYTEIRQYSGYNNITQARSDCRSLGLEIPYSERHQMTLKLEKSAADNSLSLEEVQSFWSEVLISRKRHLLSKKLIQPLTTVVRSQGFYFRPKDLQLFIEAITQAGIAIGKVTQPLGANSILTYFLARTADLEAISKALQAADQLQHFKKNPVVRISRASTEPIPTKTALIQKKGYQTVNNLTKKLGLDFAGRDRVMSLSQFMADCPSSIYQVANNFFYQESDEAKIVEYIAQRKKELGL